VQNHIKLAISVSRIVKMTAASGFFRRYCLLFSGTVIWYISLWCHNNK